MCVIRIASIVLAILSLAALSSAEEVSFEAHLEPPAGRVISGWGQFSRAWDLGQPAGKGEAEDLAAYEKAVAPHPPAMISFDVAPDSANVSGLLKRYREFAATHGFFLAQMGLNFRGLEHDVATGMRDPDLMVLADGLREVGRPVLLRIGYEFNSPDARYEPSAYIGAFRHAVEVFRQDKLNFAAVWDATAIGFSDSPYMKWYPGDDVVDWWGINLFDPRNFNRAESETFVDDAVRHRKPIIVSAAARVAKSEAEALKSYTGFFEFIRANPAAKAFSLRWPPAHQNRWPKVAAYVKQQLGNPRFIDASEAPAIFRPPRDRP